MLLEHERNYGLGRDALVIALTAARTELWFGQSIPSGKNSVSAILEVYVSILGETWGQKAKPHVSTTCYDLLVCSAPASRGVRAIP